MCVWYKINNTVAIDNSLWSNYIFYSITLSWNIIEKSYLTTWGLEPASLVSSTDMPVLDHQASPKKDASSLELSNTVSPIRPVLFLTSWLTLFLFVINTTVTVVYNVNIYIYIYIALFYQVPVWLDRNFYWYSMTK